MQLQLTILGTGALQAGETDGQSHRAKLIAAHHGVGTAELSSAQIIGQRGQPTMRGGRSARGGRGGGFAGSQPSRLTITAQRGDKSHAQPPLKMIARSRGNFHISPVRATAQRATKFSSGLEDDSD